MGLWPGRGRVWDPTTFTEEPRPAAERRRVYEVHGQASKTHPQVKPLLSDEHFSVDGTLIEAWASHKSFRPTDSYGDADGRRRFPWPEAQKRHPRTPARPIRTARLYRKAAGREAKLCYMGHAIMENRHGLAVAGMVTLRQRTPAQAGTLRRRSQGPRPKDTTLLFTFSEAKANNKADHVGGRGYRRRAPHVTQIKAITSTGKRRTRAPSTPARRGTKAMACRDRPRR